MKKIIRKIFLTVAILVSVLAGLLLCALMFRPLGNVVFSLAFGSRYHKAGETTVLIADKKQNLAIYKAANKPFLLIGPYRFSKNDDYDDFCFVNKNQVIRTATDKGADDWVRIFNLLFIVDDMTVWDRVRMPYWDDLKCDKDSSVRWDKATDSYLYSFKIHSVTIPVSFAIPAKLLTPDMLDAPNDTRAD